MADFKTFQILNEKGELVGKPSTPISDELVIKAYKTMLKTRYVDDRMITLQRQGVITFAMSALGEEACSVASAAALKPQDWMYPQYREAGIMFWRGFSIEQYVHHMFGDALDLILGRQMPNHFGSRELNVVTVSSPIGTKLPHAAGAAYAMKMQKEDEVAICYFGEGATSEGDFHVGLNFAAVRKAPCIFFCRNNGYAISTPIKSQFACEGIVCKGEGYGIASYRVDGNDFFAVYEMVAIARKLCLEGKGPVLIEAMTYRLGAHSTADDPSLYRKEDEVQFWMEKCPIKRLRRYLESKGLWDGEREKTYHEELVKEVNQAVEVARHTPKPPLASIIENVYFETPALLKEELDDVKKLLDEEK